MVKPRLNKIIPEFALGAILSLAWFCIFTGTCFKAALLIFSGFNQRIYLPSNKKELMECIC